MSPEGGVPLAKDIWPLEGPPLAEAARKEGSSSMIVWRVSTAEQGSDAARGKGGQSGKKGYTLIK